MLTRMNATLALLPLLFVTAFDASGAGRQAPKAPSISAAIVSATAWTDSGVAFVAGQSVQVRAAGFVCAGGNGVYCEAPAGTRKVQTNGNFPAPGCPAYSLIGRIGDGGTPFCIGNRNVQAADADGDLELAVNDDSPADNYGAWVALVTLPGD